MSSEPPRKGARIEIAGLSRSFESAHGSVQALTDINLSIAPGEFFCIVGPSGCGKSTLLRILAGLDRQTGGKITVDSKGWAVENAMVFQESGLFPWMSVEQNIGFGLMTRGMPASARAPRIEAAMKLVGLSQFGNGSQDIFWSDKAVMYCSTHEMPLYPGTGALSERGEHNTIVNAPLSAGDGGDAFREAFETEILPRLREFKPDILVISAGFDAHTRDPLANLNLVEADFAWVTKKLMEIADASAQGRIVSVLEGGYDLQGLSRSVAAHVTALMRG